MNQNDQPTVRSVAWAEVFPWLVIFRCWRLAMRPSLLLVAVAACFLTPLGWRYAAAPILQYAGESRGDRGPLLLPEEIPLPTAEAEEEEADEAQESAGASAPSEQGTGGSAMTAEAPTAPTLPPWSERWNYFVAKFPYFQFPGQGAALWPAARVPEVPAERLGPGRFPPDRQLLHGAARTVPNVFWYYTRPFVEWFRLDNELPHLAFWLVGGVWTLLVWGVAAGVITRIAVVELGRQDRVGLRETLRFVTRRFVAFTTSPLCVVLMVVFFAVWLALGGLLLRWNATTWVAAVLWFLPMLAGAAMAALAIGLFAGWPLMWGAVASEHVGDFFDALQRSFTYTYSRPLRLLWYALLVTLTGAFGWLIVWYFVYLVIGMAHWGVAWGATRANLVTALDTHAAGLIIGVFEQLVRALLSAYPYCFFWCAAGAVYLLIRQDVDPIPMDEVYMEDEEERYEVPPMTPPAEQQEKPDSGKETGWEPPAGTAEAEPSSSTDASAAQGAGSPPGEGAPDTPASTPENPPQGTD